MSCDQLVINLFYRTTHGYTCDVQSYSILAEDDHEITKLSGRHRRGKSNEDVTVFLSNGKIVNYFPKNIKKYFNNVQKILISAANISRLTKQDLQPFGSQLKYFLFADNKLEEVPKDLFDYTPNIEHLQLQTNLIKFVEDGAFSKLQQLKFLYFQVNPCHSGYAENDRKAVVKLIREIEGKCKELPPTTTEKNELLELETEHKKEIEELEADYEAEIFKLTVEIENLKAGNERCWKKEASLRKRLESRGIRVEEE